MKNQEKKHYIETLHAGYQQRFEVTKTLLEQRSDHQNLLIFENPVFGRVLALDGAIQTTQNDEFIYHEMLAHVPLIAHGAAARVLIIGGGDGGVVREVLRHRSVQQVVLVEIDQQVIDLARKYLPQHTNGCFNDPRLEIVIADGTAFVSQKQNALFDVILSDSTDPVGPGEKLFESTFYAHCANLLHPKGIFVAQSGVPFLQREEWLLCYQRLSSYFPEVSFYSAAVPTYVGGVMLFAFASHKNYQNKPKKTITQRTSALKGLRYYNPEIHFGSFALPQYLLDRLPDTYNKSP